MTISKIIETLKKSGCNSKQQVIDSLENMSRDDLLELQRDVKERIAKIENRRRNIMYKCKRCKAIFEEPKEIHTSYEVEYGIANDFSSHTPLILQTCPYCGSERIKEYEEEN